MMPVVTEISMFVVTEIMMSVVTIMVFVVTDINLICLRFESSQLLGESAA
jgi:hypothetical protein